MEPGREMDALIAEKVMGWDTVHFVKFADGTIPFGASPDMQKEADDGGFICSTNKEVPEFSTDIAAAWLVVEKMGLFGGTGCSLVGPLPGQKWHIHFGKISSDSVIGDTAPHAICLAALKAVGVNLEAVV